MILMVLMTISDDLSIIPIHLCSFPYHDDDFYFWMERHSMMMMTIERWNQWRIYDTTEN